LHEFKSADNIYSQPPVMSLVLTNQKLGSHSGADSKSNKFILKGRQTGTMHRGHQWVFRAESYDTMLAWYDDIKNLTEKIGEARNAFVRSHARSFSSGSQKASSVSGDSGLKEDEADEVPYSVATTSSMSISKQQSASSEKPPQRPQSGGRFPSDLQVNRHLQAPLSPSGGSSDIDHDLTTAAGGLAAGGAAGYAARDVQDSGAPPVDSQAYVSPVQGTVQMQPPMQFPQQQEAKQYQPEQYQPQPVQTCQSQLPQQVQTYQPRPPQQYALSAQAYPSQPSQSTIYSYDPATTSDLDLQPQAQQKSTFTPAERHGSAYGDWMALAAGGAVLEAGAFGAGEYWHNKRQQAEQLPQDTHKDEALPEAVEPAAAPIPLRNPTRTLDGATDESAPGSTGPASRFSASTTGSEFPTGAASSQQEKSEGSGLEGGSGADAATAPAHTAYDTNSDGSVNARRIGRIFPSVIRHDTSTSISNLHVPGEYLRGSAA